MRYFLLENTLVIRGSFRAAGPGTIGAIVMVTTILNHARAKTHPALPAAKELELAAAAAGTGGDYAGLVSAGPIGNLCVLQFDFLTLFLTAALMPVTERGPAAVTTSVIICSGQGMSDAALREAIGVAEGAVAETLAEGGWQPADSPDGTIIAACEGPQEHPAASRDSPAGSRIHAALSFGITEVLRQAGRPEKHRPLFFIFSRFGGGHWVEWTPENCPYYPCHFKGQRCDYCYCPLYPCCDESLGQWSAGSNGLTVWNCSACTMIHEPAVADYLRANPEASKGELLRVWRGRKKGLRQPLP